MQGKKLTMNSGNILVERLAFDERREADMDARAIEQGYIDPNQFDEAHEQVPLKAGVDEYSHPEDVMTDAQHIADKYGIAVKVETRMWEDEGSMDWGHKSLTVQPNGGR